MIAQLAHFWTAYGQSIAVLVGGAFGWFGKMGQLRLAQRKARYDAGEQALRLVATMQDTIDSYSTELETLRARRWSIDDLMQDLHAQAIAARLMVHDLERRLGLPESIFPPLPAFPTTPPAQEPLATAKSSGAAGATAAPTA